MIEEIAALTAMYPLLPLFYCLKEGYPDFGGLIVSRDV